MISIVLPYWNRWQATDKALALMAECYDELRQLGEATQSYRIALSKDPKRGEWWYKFGRMSMDRGARRHHPAIAEQP